MTGGDSGGAAATPAASFASSDAPEGAASAPPARAAAAAAAAASPTDVTVDMMPPPIRARPDAAAPAASPPHHPAFSPRAQQPAGGGDQQGRRGSLDIAVLRPTVFPGFAPHHQRPAGGTGAGAMPNLLTRLVDADAATVLGQEPRSPKTAAEQQQPEAALSGARLPPPVAGAAAAAALPADAPAAPGAGSKETSGTATPMQASTGPGVQPPGQQAHAAPLPSGGGAAAAATRTTTHGSSAAGPASGVPAPAQLEQQPPAPTPAHLLPPAFLAGGAVTCTGASVLVAEDDRTNGILITRILRKFGFSEARPGRPCDLILDRPGWALLCPGATHALRAFSTVLLG